MGNRLSKIYTRTGDEGTTGLATGERVAKDSARIKVTGDVDELNCVIGIVLTHPMEDSLRQTLEEVQHKLFDLGGELSMPGHQLLDPADVTFLEQTLDAANADLPPLKEFILPGGSPAAAACHLARAVSRRAERHLVSLAREEPVSEIARAYLNRLSDLLFVYSRVLARAAGGSEVFWKNPRERGREVPGGGN